jgi:hypothetical protein
LNIEENFGDMNLGIMIQNRFELALPVARTLLQQHQLVTHPVLEFIGGVYFYATELLLFIYMTVTVNGSSK